MKGKNIKTRWNGKITGFKNRKRNTTTKYANERNRKIQLKGKRTGSTNTDKRNILIKIIKETGEYKWPKYVNEANTERQMNNKWNEKWTLNSKQTIKKKHEWNTQLIQPNYMNAGRVKKNKWKKNATDQSNVLNMCDKYKNKGM